MHPSVQIPVRPLPFRFVVSVIAAVSLLAAAWIGAVLMVAGSQP